MTGNVTRETIMKWIKRHRQYTVQKVKENWALAKIMEKRAYAEDVDSGVPDRSFFSTQGQHPKDGEWWKWDGEVTKESALRAYTEELALTAEEHAQKAAASDKQRSSSVSSLPERLRSTSISSQHLSSRSPRRESMLPSIDEGLSQDQPSPTPAPRTTRQTRSGTAGESSRPRGQQGKQYGAR